MKIEVLVKKEFEVKTLLIDAGVRYWEDADVNGVNDIEGSLIPCRVNDRWMPIVDIENGQILNWELGKKAIVHYKVCDNGEYWLRDEEGNNVIKSNGYYVPSFLGSMGDYIELEINENGIIIDWSFDEEEFIQEY